jgi:hypothetical protein
VAAITFIILTIISRMYLGQHFPQDTLAGLVLATAVLLSYLLWMQNGYAQFQNQILGRRFWTAVLIPATIAFLYFTTLWLMGAPDSSVPWGEFLPSAEEVSLNDSVSALAVLFGLGTGFVLEGGRIRFSVLGAWWLRLLRYVVGLVTTLVILYGLSLLFALLLPPDLPLWVALTFRFFRYGLTAFVAAFYLPMFFVYAGLADALPLPTIAVAPPKKGKADATDE